MDRKIEWADFKFGPVNLSVLPRNLSKEELERQYQEAMYFKQMDYDDDHAERNQSLKDRF